MERKRFTVIQGVVCLECLLAGPGLPELRGEWVRMGGIWKQTPRDTVPWRLQPGLAFHVSTALQLIAPQLRPM